MHDPSDLAVYNQSLTSIQKGLKIRWPQGRVGSTPSSRTTFGAADIALNYCATRPGPRRSLCLLCGSIPSFFSACRFIPDGRLESRYDSHRTTASDR